MAGGKLKGAYPRRFAMRRTLAAIFMILLVPATTAGQEKVKFPVGASSHVLGFAPLWAAAKQGFLEREGLDAQAVLILGTAPTIQALIGESIHVALAAVDGPIAAVEQGGDLVLIGAGSKTTHMIMGGKNYKTYEDLRGATIGTLTLTSGVAFLLRRVLKTKGLEFPSDYKLLNVGGTGPAFAALSAGHIDAAILAVPVAFHAQESGLNVIGRVTDVFPNYLLSAFSVRRSWAARPAPRGPLSQRYSSGHELAKGEPTGGYRFPS
jgi:ABC-type nitrate/sulfonate/bicarbonate transport system substrate-binding protein